MQLSRHFETGEAEGSEFCLTTMRELASLASECFCRGRTATKTIRLSSGAKADRKKENNESKGEKIMTDRQLMSMAREASLNAYVPYSHFAVGAALECDDGTVFTGCNVENAALGSTICAERTACCKAVSEGHRSFRRIAIYADSENWCTPCGACRQFLAEFSPEMEVLCAKAGNRYVSYKLSELLPHTFNF